MKKIGIVGGISWHSTVEYYSGLCRLAELAPAAQHYGVPEMPEIVIESLNLRIAASALGTDAHEDSWREFDSYHAEALKRLKASGATFALIASNTAHHRLPAIVKGVNIPVLDLFDEIARAAATIAKSGTVATDGVLILGTETTMNSVVLRNSFLKFGIHATRPTFSYVREATIALIRDLQLGKNTGARGRLETIISRGIRTEGRKPPMICLACTELPLAFGDVHNEAVFENQGITYLNSTRIHIEAAHRFASTEENPSS